jgi:glycosyltransferase involved in cell wall biosynthesis
MMHCDWLIELPATTVAKRLKAADLVMGCSSYISEGVRASFPRLPVPTEALHNGSSPDSLSQDLDDRLGAAEELKSPLDKIVLFVGRISPEKGVHSLIGSMRTVLERVPNARLVIAGGFYPNPPSPLIYRTRHGREHDFEAQKPGYAQYVEALAAPFGDRVQFLSDIPHGQLGAWYEAADVFVHPALWDEPFGMILTEAMAFGCPVVSTRSGGIPEIVIDGTTGLLVEPGDEQALGEAISRVLSDPELARGMGEAGRARLVNSFTWDRTAARLSELLSSIVR